MKIFSSKRSKALILSLLAFVPLVGVFSYGDDIRTAFNDASYGSTPLEKRDLITFREPGGDHAALISGNSISKTGDIPVHAWFSPGNLKLGNMHIDWSADDTFTRTFRAMEDKVAAQVQATPALTSLNAKPSWTPEDRVTWDAGVANITAAVCNCTPGLDKYRTDTDGKLPHLRDVNDLGLDIAHKTYTHAFDCKHMSIVKAVLQERMAERFLPAAERSRYFVAFGEAELTRFDDAPGGHAYIVVEKNNAVTGVIEATETSDVYRRPAKPYAFSTFATGQEFVSKDGAVYGFEFTHAKADQLRLAFGIKPYEIFMRELKEKRRIQLQEMNSHNKTPAAPKPLPPGVGT